MRYVPPSDQHKCLIHQIKGSAAARLSPDAVIPHHFSDCWRTFDQTSETLNVKDASFKTSWNKVDPLFFLHTPLNPPLHLIVYSFSLPAQASNSSSKHQPLMRLWRRYQQLLNQYPWEQRSSLAVNQIRVTFTCWGICRVQSGAISHHHTGNIKSWCDQLEVWKCGHRAAERPDVCLPKLSSDCRLQLRDFNTCRKTQPASAKNVTNLLFYNETIIVWNKSTLHIRK